MFFFLCSTGLLIISLWQILDFVPNAFFIKWGKNEFMTFSIHSFFSINSSLLNFLPFLHMYYHITILFFPNWKANFCIIWIWNEIKSMQLTFPSFFLVMLTSTCTTKKSWGKIYDRKGDLWKRCDDEIDSEGRN